MTKQEFDAANKKNYKSHLAGDGVSGLHADKCYRANNFRDSDKVEDHGAVSRFKRYAEKYPVDGIEAPSYMGPSAAERFVESQKQVNREMRRRFLVLCLKRFA